jgi:hypothetical protein
VALITVLRGIVCAWTIMYYVYWAIQWLSHILQCKEIWQLCAFKEHAAKLRTELSHNKEKTLLPVFWVFFETRVWTQDLVFAKWVLCHLSHSSSPFCSGYFGDVISQTICNDWSQTVILQISVSHVARTTGAWLLLGLKFPIPLITIQPSCSFI